MPYQLSEAARSDVADILRQTMRRFGAVQRHRYGRLMERAAETIGDDPVRAGSHPRDDLRPGVRSFHIELAGRRRGAAAHLLYYVSATLDDGHEGVIILRVLHERMDPARHIGDEP